MVAANRWVFVGDVVDVVVDVDNIVVIDVEVDADYKKVIKSPR